MIAAGPIRLGPSLTLIMGIGRRMQRPIRVGQMWSRQANESGAPRHQYRIDVIGLVDVADCQGRNPRLVADAVGEWRLEHAAIDRLCQRRGLPRRDVDEIDAGLGEMAIGGFEKRVAIQWIDPRLNAIEQALDQFAPPAFVVVRSRRACRRPRRHLAPDASERIVQSPGFEGQSLARRDQRVMPPDAFR